MELNALDAQVPAVCPRGSGGGTYLQRAALEAEQLLAREKENARRLQGDDGVEIADLSLPMWSSR
jgi:hypothetical protein